MWDPESLTLFLHASSVKRASTTVQQAAVSALLGLWALKPPGWSTGCEHRGPYPGVGSRLDVYLFCLTMVMMYKKRMYDICQLLVLSLHHQPHQSRTTSPVFFHLHNSVLWKHTVSLHSLGL